jgi:hypothetical protein
MLCEAYFRIYLAVPYSSAIWPEWNTAATIAITLTASLMPMRAAPLSCMLLLRTSLNVWGRAAKCWPIGLPLDARGWLTQARLDGAATAVAIACVTVNERRAERAWRAQRARAAAKAGKHE